MLLPRSSSPDERGTSGPAPYSLVDFLDALPHLVWMATPQGRVDHVWGRVDAYAPLTPAPEGSLEWRTLVHPDDLARTEQAWSHALESHEPYAADHRLRMRDGSYRWHVSRACFVEDERLGPAHWYGTATDIQELKQQEEQLATTGWRTERAEFGGGVGLWEWDLKNREIYLSPAMWKIHGHSPQADITPPELWLRSVHPEDIELVRQSLAQVFESHASSYHAEYRIVRPDRSVVWIESNARVERGPDGAPIRISGSHYDITRRKQLEEKVRQSEMEFRRLLDAMPQLVWTAGPTGAVEYINEQMAQYLPPTAVGSTHWVGQTLLHPDDRERTHEAWRSAVANGTVFEIEHRLEIPHGVYAWHVSRAVPSKTPEGQLIRWHGTTTNINAQKHAQEAHEQVANLRQAQLTEANEQIQGVVFTLAHHLRAPARAMQGFSELLLSREGARLTPDGCSLLKRIRRSAEFMDRLTLDLIAYEQIREWQPQLQPVRLLDAWKAALAMHAPEIERRGALVITPPDLPSVIADPPSLVRVFSELLKNALKFTSPRERPRITIEATEQPQTWRVAVVDNGVGVHREQANSIFLPFHRARASSGGGTGFGLAMVKTRLERMQGVVGLEPAQNGGSRFYFELRKSNPLPPHDQPRPPARGR